MNRELCVALLGLIAGCGSGGSTESGVVSPELDEAGCSPVGSSAEFTMSTGSGYDHQPIDLFVRADGVVFWSVQNDIFRTDANGTAVVLHGAPKGMFGNLVADAERVYFTSIDLVGVVPESGGETQTLIELPGLPYTELALHGEHLYAIRASVFPQGTAIHRIHRLTGEISVLADWEPGVPRNLAVDVTNVYWTNTALGAGKNTIRCVPQSGGSILTLAEGLHPPRGLAVRNGTLYWTELHDAGHGRIRSLPATGGVVTTIADDLEYPESIAVDGDFVYWSERTGSLRRRHLEDGCTTTLLTGLATPGRIALRSGTLYYVDSAKLQLGVVSTARKVEEAAPAELPWAFESPMPYQNRHDYVAAAAVDGKIYCFGGFYLWGVRDYLEIYDTPTKTWSWGAHYPSTVAGAAVGVIGGRIYLAGGVNYEAGENFLKTAYLFDPATQTYATLPELNEPRFGAASFVLDGKLYVMGGWGKDYHPLATTEVFDPAVEHWVAGPEMPLALQTHGAAVLGGKVYVMGGTTPWQSISASMYVWDPQTDLWTSAPSMNVPRYGFAVAAVSGRIVVAGGWDGLVLRGSTEWFDPAENAWHETTPLPLAGGEGNRAAVIGNRLYVLGSNGPDVNSVVVP